MTRKSINQPGQQAEKVELAKGFEKKEIPGFNIRLQELEEILSETTRESKVIQNDLRDYGESLKEIELSLIVQFIKKIGQLRHKIEHIREDCRDQLKKIEVLKYKTG